MFNLVSIGDIKLDTFVVLDDASLECELKDRNCKLCLPYGAKLLVKTFEPQIAGSAPNVAVALARLGLKTATVSMVGHDATAHLAAVRLKEEGVATQYVVENKKTKSSFSIVLLFKGERTMLTAHAPHKYRLLKCPPTKWLYVSELGEDFEVLYKDVIGHVEKKKVKLALNPGTVQIRAGYKKLKSILKRTEVLFVNKEEGHALLQEKNHLDMERLIRTLWKLGPSTVVLTDGKNGAYAFDGGDILFVPSFPSHRVETTGAGDSFASAFLASRMYKKDLGESLKWGAVNSASVIAVVGPQPGLLHRNEIERRLRIHPEFKISIT
ncbi:carbohydrate kinase family protein [Candidatus Uhrbacteria bacterium]|nr:carbohydrate kinase family protein [Candidatus Uhrbacteria bacterium]